MNSSVPNHRIANLVQLALHLFVLDLKIGDRRLAARTPVDDVLAAIDQPFFIQADEDLAHGARQAFVHGEVFAVPIDRRAQPLHLVENRAAVMPLPFPHALDESFAAQIARAFLPSRRQLALHHHLRGDAGVVGSRQPQRQIRRACDASATMMSISVWLSMWPMCRRPVTFGGGSSRVNTGRVSPGGGVGTEKASP